jgi:FkbM family methyltransferase
MRLREKLHAYHRFWRYRLRSERQEIALLMSEKLRGATVLDIGANRGIYSYWMHRAVGPAGRVIAFEPQPELVDHLADLKRTFRLDRLTIVGAGLSDKPGELSLIRPRGHWGGASFEWDAPQFDCDVMRTPVVTLDDYLKSHDVPPPQFIKCDVEGHEASVFRGAAKTLAAHHPTLLFEQHDGGTPKNDLLEYLSDLGYAGYFLLGGELLSVKQLPHLRGKIDKPFLNYVYRLEDRAA